MLVSWVWIVILFTKNRGSGCTRKSCWLKSPIVRKSYMGISLLFFCILSVWKWDHGQLGTDSLPSLPTHLPKQCRLPLDRHSGLRFPHSDSIPGHRHWGPIQLLLWQAQGLHSCLKCHNGLTENKCMQAYDVDVVEDQCFPSLDIWWFQHQCFTSGWVLRPDSSQPSKKFRQHYNAWV